MNILDVYFADHKYPLTSHQLDSYKEFIRTNIPNIIKTGNPITMIKNNDETNIKVDINIGGHNGKNIYIDRPIINVNDTNILLTPNEARLRNLTYQTNLYADVEISIYEGNNVKPVFNKIFTDTPIGTIPIMVHSDLCLLHGQNKEVLKN